jgi:hypothetical protein
MATEKKISNELRKLTSVPIPKESEKDNYSLSVNETLFSLFDKAIQSQYADMSEAIVVITPSKVADYQCNSAMAISQVISILIGNLLLKINFLLHYFKLLIRF